MTQAVQPFGFASPKAPPLSIAAPPPRLAESQQGQLPDAFAPPAAPVPELDQIAPAPPDHRDPTAPFMDVPAPDQTPPWQPHQPLPLSSPAASTEVDPSTLPPPTGPALSALPPPTGLPVTAAAPSPYPMNPYATGPYQPPGLNPAHPGGPRPPVTFQQTLQASDGFVLFGLALGLWWPGLAPYVLIAAAIRGLLIRSHARALLAAAAVLNVVVTVVWWLGYFANSQWHSTAQLLCIVCLVGVPLITYQALRR